MSEFGAPDAATGILALAISILYAAWHEYKARNQRDSRVLAVLGVASAVGGAVTWLQ